MKKSSMDMNSVMPSSLMKVKLDPNTTKPSDSAKGQEAPSKLTEQMLDSRVK